MTNDFLKKSKIKGTSDIGHIRPRSNAVRRDASPLECSGAFCHGLLRTPSTAPSTATVIVAIAIQCMGISSG